MKINNINISYEITVRRLGDITTSYANVSKAKEEQKWEAMHGLLKSA